MRQERHDCFSNNTSVKLVKNFGFDNDTSENILSHPYIRSKVIERLQGELRTTCKKCFVPMPKWF